MATLMSMCIRTVAQNMDLLEKGVSDLPASLLKDLLPHLNMFYLDRIEKTALLKKVSISLQFAWAAKWRDLNRTWRCKLKFMQPEENWKQKCLESVFHMVLFRKTQVQNILSNLSEKTLLCMSAKHVQVLSLSIAAQGGCQLASEELRPVLSILEESVRCLRLFDAMALLKHGHTDILFILHRLLDHGSVIEVVLKRTPDSLFNWITSRCRGPYCIDPQTSAASCIRDTLNDKNLCEEEGPPAPKCPRLGKYMDERLCSEFFPSCNVNGRCHVGQIHSLDLEVSSLATVSSHLSLWLCLRSLHLYGTQPLWEDDVADFIESLRKLFLNPHCSLRDLSIGNVCSKNLLADLLAACLTLFSLSLDINLPRDNRTTPVKVQFRPDKELSLEKLSLKSTAVQTVENFPAVLQHAPRLSSLHVVAINHAQLLLHTLPESNPLLKVLILEDINLTECHQEIINLLENSVLEELTLKDCRLLEKCTEKNDFLVPFVMAVRGLCSLRSLSLSQNRLATSVIEIAGLFLGDCPSKITSLDLSSNFILPVDLLKFGQRIETYCPAQRLTLDLRCNPLDRDLNVKDQALKKLLPFCNILTDDWDSRSTMADHVSVM